MLFFGYGQDDEAAFQPHVVPLQPQDFTPAHAGGEGDEEACIKPVFFE